ncbi:hypothetical protein [Pseudophaeobacter sp.]|uniref:hypothetical protein n=1 Tax=Pseudophaeobacter sp. TaxID=1971739 RepID=UPI003299B2D6
MEVITRILNYAGQHGFVAVLVVLLLLIGTGLDKIVKRNSKISFARVFLSQKRTDYLIAASISLEVLDNLFNTRRIFGIVVPNFRRLFVFSVVVSSLIMVMYFLMNLSRFKIGTLRSDGVEILQPILMFSLGDGNAEFVFIWLLPLLILISNPMLDVVSYSQTRIFLAQLIKSLNKTSKHQLVKITFFIVADLAYSFLLFSLFIFGTRRLYNEFVLNLNPDIPIVSKSFFETIISAAQEPLELVSSYISGFGVEGLYGGILISTFVSTLFIWFVFASFLLSYAQDYTNRLLRYLSRHTHIVRFFFRRPFTICAYLMIALVLAISVVWNYL